MKSKLLHVYIYWVHILQIPASKSLYELPLTRHSDLSFVFFYYVQQQFIGLRKHIRKQPEIGEIIYFQHVKSIDFEFYISVSYLGLH